jgi:hypothetical protein
VEHHPVRLRRRTQPVVYPSIQSFHNEVRDSTSGRTSELPILSASEYEVTTKVLVAKEFIRTTAS